MSEKMGVGRKRKEARSKRKALRQAQDDNRE
jgi:hypothetical protein